MTEQELRIVTEAKFEAVKSFIYLLNNKYEELQDSDEYDNLQPYEKNKIDGKMSVLEEIKDFIFNNS